MTQPRLSFAPTLAQRRAWAKLDKLATLSDARGNRGKARKLRQQAQEALKNTRTGEGK